MSLFDDEMRRQREDLSSLETARHTLGQEVKRLRDEAQQAERLAGSRLQVALREVAGAKAELEELKAETQTAREQIVTARQTQARAEQAMRDMAAREVGHREVSDQAAAARQFLVDNDDEIESKERELAQVRQNMQLCQDAVSELHEAEDELRKELAVKQADMTEREDRQRQAEADLAKRQEVPSVEWNELQDARDRLEEEQGGAYRLREAAIAKQEEAEDALAHAQRLKALADETASTLRQGEKRLEAAKSELEHRVKAQAELVSRATTIEADARIQLAGMARREAAAHARETLLDKQHQTQEVLERELNERVEIIRRSSKALTERERQAAQPAGG